MIAYYTLVHLFMPIFLDRCENNYTVKSTEILIFERYTYTRTITLWRYFVLSSGLYSLNDKTVIILTRILNMYR